MTPAENLASVSETDAESREAAAPQAGPFVINLCSSSTPMALPKADLPELQRFNFFVSRRFEEGRERFRLHMGYFDTLTEAEGWLGLVREIYPGAWAGEAPGKKLRARAAAAAAAQAAHATGPHALSAPAQQPEEPSAGIPADVAARVPTLHPPEETHASLPEGVDRKDAVSAAQAPVTQELELEVSQPQLAEVVKLTPPAKPRSGSAAARRASHATAPAPSGAPLTDSNIKEVLAALDEPARGQAPAGITRAMPAPVLKPGTATLSDPQALQVLEGRTQEGAKPAAFAVQLHWSVQPILLDKVPPLAIFSAYSLYCIEGSRQGRKWYGLRLGFFNDPISAKQVAGYVRSEFASVAVVPVSAEERKRVSGENASVPVRSAPKAPERRSALDSGEFKLFDPDHPVASGTSATAATPAAAKPPSAAVRQLRPVAASRAGGKINARERRAPQTLEETLEILGAHQLTIDESKQGGTGTGPARKAEKSAPFTRLLERLGERVRKS